MRRKIPLPEKREKQHNGKNERLHKLVTSVSLHKLHDCSLTNTVISCPRWHPSLHATGGNAGGSSGPKTKVDLHATKLVTLLNSGRWWSPKWGEWLEYWGKSDRVSVYGYSLKEENMVVSRGSRMSVSGSHCQCHKYILERQSLRRGWNQLDGLGDDIICNYGRPSTTPPVCAQEQAGKHA